MRDYLLYKFQLKYYGRFNAMVGRILDFGFIRQVHLLVVCRNKEKE